MSLSILQTPEHATIATEANKNSSKECENVQAFCNTRERY